MTKAILLISTALIFSSLAFAENSHSDRARKITSMNHFNVQFNEVKVVSIQFLKDISILPGTTRTEISSAGGRYQKCFLIHDKDNSERVLSAGRYFEVETNRAVTTSYSSSAGFGFAQFIFKGLESARIVACDLYSDISSDGTNTVKGVSLGKIEELLGASLVVNTAEVNEIK